MRWVGVRRPLAAALTAATLVVGAGCTASEPSPPTGVDGLTIPTPSPDPEDFVATVDNPWLVLEDGSWAYDVADGDLTYALEVSVETGPEILGVPTTAVRRVPEGLEKKERPTLTASTDWYAQDRAGNVWWLGRKGEWQAGEAGAEAGLVMPAEPRFGDGFRSALAAGVDVRAEVVEYDEAAGVLRLEVRSGDVVRVEEYTRGVGLVLWQIDDADVSVLRQVQTLDG